MVYEMRCPYCGMLIRHLPEAVGATFVCPKCGKEVELPGGRIKTERKTGHKALRVKDGKIESFDPHPLSVETIADRLKKQWRDIHSGGCKIVSMGDQCECHLCLIDRLQALADEEEKRRKREEGKRQDRLLRQARIQYDSP